MISSVYQIDFITASATFRLLSVGDLISDEISPKVGQSAEGFAPIGAEWGRSIPQGGATTTLAWSTRRTHGSHAESRAFCMRHAASFPTGQAGTLRLAITGGETWDIANATLTASEPIPLAQGSGFRTLTSYQITGGKLSPAVAIALFSGIPWEWILQDWDALTGDWDSL